MTQAVSVVIECHGSFFKKLTESWRKTCHMPVNLKNPFYFETSRTIMASKSTARSTVSRNQKISVDKIKNARHVKLPAFWRGSMGQRVPWSRLGKSASWTPLILFRLALHLWVQIICVVGYRILVFKETLPKVKKHPRHTRTSLKHIKHI